MQETDRPIHLRFSFALMDEHKTTQGTFFYICLLNIMKDVSLFISLIPNV